ncbi:hypothetical protein GCM10027018_16380 [Paenibacillus thermoaerophilus]|jgi:hypothetical protein
MRLSWGAAKDAALMPKALQVPASQAGGTEGLFFAAGVMPLSVASSCQRFASSSEPQAASIASA